MKHYRIYLQQQAENDLENIWDYLAERNEPAAAQLFSEISRALDMLKTHPRMGQAKPTIRPNARHFPVGKYTILYKVDDDQRLVTLTRIIHSSRDLRGLQA